mgnify:CR=1 FL=1
MDKPKTKSVVSDIIDEMISLTKPKSNKDIKDELARDKINYLIWTIGVAVKDLQKEIDKLDNNREASWIQKNISKRTTM